MKCEACDLDAGHEGAHEATFKLCDASPDWTGSPEQWADWNARVAAGTAVTIRVVNPPEAEAAPARPL